MSSDTLTASYGDEDDEQRASRLLPVLYVDDEPHNIELFRLQFADRYVVHTAHSAREALTLLEQHDFGALLSDERMPGMSGIELLSQAMRASPDTVRVIVSAYADGARLLDAMNRGHAYEYIIKPWNRDELGACLDRALAIARRRRSLTTRAALGELLMHEEQPEARIGVGKLLGQLEPLIRRFARSDATVLVQGETGVGKERVARAIHELSGRASRPWVALNCAAVPDSLAESELFGHEQGAFTGAQKTRKGRFELASGGTLFLDEIGDISARAQVSLLRALQERRIERVGGSTSIPVDVRVVVATHRHLEDCVRLGTFRQDLFYRLNVLNVRVPPLRERRDDIPELVAHFLKKWAKSAGTSVRRVNPDVYAALRQYSWPGNVRELENMVLRALVVCDGKELTLDDFTFAPLTNAPGPQAVDDRPLREQAQAAEQRELRELMLCHGGNISRAARFAGMPRTTLISRLKRSGLS